MVGRTPLRSINRPRRTIIQVDIVHEDFEDLANIFNDYFVDIGKILQNRLWEIITIILIAWLISTNLILFSSNKFSVIPLKN